MVQPGCRAGRSQLVAPLEFPSVTNADNAPVVDAGGSKERKRRWKASVSGHGDMCNRLAASRSLTHAGPMIGK
jgi:hypothetical protein